MIWKSAPFVVALAGAVIIPSFAPAFAADTAARAGILDGLAAEVRRADPAFAGFSAERGAALFTATHTGGQPDTPSCTTCPGPAPTAAGRTRAGKPIGPMALSAAPARYTDPEKVAKWFDRNCRSVLGRACTALEKGDFITFMVSR